MNARGMIAGVVFLAGALVAAGAGAAELKVLSDTALKPALEELVKGFEASSKDKVKVDYASAADIEKKIGAEEEYDVVIVDKAIATKFGAQAKVAIGSIKAVAKKDDKLVYEAATTNWTTQPGPVGALIAFLTTPKAAEVYKSKGLQPG